MSIRRLASALVILVLVVPTLAVTPLASAVPTPTYSTGAVPFAPIAFTGGTTLSMGDNSFTAAFPIGFNTPFFGQSEPLFWVSANGFITLRGPTSDGCCEGGTIPSRDSPNEGVVAGFWTDLNPSLGGTIRFRNVTAPPGRGEGATQVLLVDFTNVPLATDPTKLQTFQFQVYNTGVIEVHWTQVDAGGLVPATIGIERGDGAVGVQVARGATLTRVNEALRFTPTIQDLPLPPPVVTQVTPNAARPGTTITVNGDGFVSTSQAIIGGVPAATTFQFAQQLSVVVPDLPEGPANVTVVNPDDQSHTLVNGLQVRPPLDPNAPTYTLSTPAFGMLPLTAATELPTVTDEAIVGPLPLGFTTTFFGEPVSEFFVTGNGFITFDPESAGCCDGGAIPDPQSPNALVAGFWTDLDPQAGGSHVRMATRAAPPGRNATLVTVVEFENVPMFPNQPARATFQIQVYDSGVYEVHIASGDPNGNRFTVGIEDGFGERGVQALRSFDAVSSLAFRFSPSVPTVPPTLLSVSPDRGQRGATINVTGAGFAANAQARVDGFPATTLVIDDQTLQFLVPGIPEGLTSVVIRNADGGVSAPLPFTVLAAPGDPLTLTAVTPDAGREGDVVTLSGTGFDAQTRAFFGAQEASVLARSATQLQVQVPSGLAGIVDVSVTAGTAAATLAGAFAVLDGPVIHSVAPSAVRARDTFRVAGAAFGSSPVVLVGDRALATTVVGPGALDAIVSPLVPIGRHDVTVLTDGLTATLEGALVVLPSPDLSVEAIAIERAAIATDAGAVPIDIVAGQRIVVTVKNVGADVADGGVLALSWRRSDAIDALQRAPAQDEEFARVAVPELLPGESASLEAQWRETGALGEFILSARATVADDTRASNDLREVRTRVIVGGLAGVTPCDVRCEPTPPLRERRTESTQETEATDTHESAVTRFRVVTGSARFSFDAPDRIFDTHTTDAEGADNTCTVWRFFGGRGDLMVEAAPDDGIEGLVSVLAAGSSSAEGARSDRTTTRAFVLGVEVDRFSTSTSSEVTSARSAYEVPALESVRVEAQGLRGDFARCTRTLGTSVTETFTWAALPGDLEQRAPNTSGSGTAATFVVEYHEKSTTSTTEREGLPFSEVVS